eukprot:462754_1
MISSAKHSAIDLMFLNAERLAPATIKDIAWLTRVKGDTSTACLRTTPALPTRVESSRGPPFSSACNKICNGFVSFPFMTEIISNALFTMLHALLNHNHNSQQIKIKIKSNKNIHLLATVPSVHH